jgi:hypothetical protein
MLRTAVLIFACLLLALGAYLCALGLRAGGGIQLLSSAAVLLLGTLFERWRYRNKQAAADGDWQVTAERFIDPESGQQIEVLYDSKSGERRYREVG